MESLTSEFSTRFNKRGREKKTNLTIALPIDDYKELERYANEVGAAKVHVLTELIRLLPKNKSTKQKKTV